MRTVTLRYGLETHTYFISCGPFKLGNLESLTNSGGMESQSIESSVMRFKGFGRDERPVDMRFHT